ncbi:hypothetical protein DSM3645_11057 [Blastopirellula marina DSM 3645]|uniref:Uncharacterized protein n=1 Tax=Blastopirellula marina DSM 3645 TaxID=314230 RepID=A3ZSV4_9BACT|nr:hypothetical protein DSM3645_11057 [Blastopirellula marina DSM 3645]
MQEGNEFQIALLWIASQSRAKQLQWRYLHPLRRDYQQLHARFLETN